MILDLLRWLAFTFVDLFVTKNQKTCDKSMLLVRVDGIGDYVLFRNFLKCVKDSSRYGNYKITLVGNEIWKDLALGLDIHSFDHTIFVSKKKFTRNIFYRYQVLRELNRRSYEVVLSPAYSRELFFADWIVHSVSARQKIGSQGDLTNRTQWQARLGNSFFTSLINAKPDIQFEFFRNREFFEELLGERVAIERPGINSNKAVPDIALPDEYALLFIGSSSVQRKWPIAHYAAIALYLRAQFDLKIVVCGGKTDIPDAVLFQRLFNHDFVNLVGNISLIQLIGTISHAKIMLTNETNAAHFAAAISRAKFLVISNGNHFGRFTPYPKSLTDKYYAIYPEIIEENLADYDRLLKLFGQGSNLNISSIDIESVKRRVKDMLN